MSRSSSAALPEHIRRIKSDKIRTVIFQIMIASLKVLKGHRTERKSHISLGSHPDPASFVRRFIKDLRTPSLADFDESRVGKIQYSVVYSAALISTIDSKANLPTQRCRANLPTLKIVKMAKCRYAFGDEYDYKIFWLKEDGVWYKEPGSGFPLQEG
jgi:hypothetical protein